MEDFPNNPCDTGGLPDLNVALTRNVRDLLGPGLRRAIWVQGCRKRCPKCISPAWRYFKPARFVTPEALADEILCDPDIEGLTISGGEPMLQASGLAKMVGIVRGTRDLTVITFSGYKIEDLRDNPPGPGVNELLKVTDVLIDGPYKASMDDDVGMRGSANQRIHFLTTRIPPDAYDFEGKERKSEILIREDGSVLVLGVPPNGLTLTLRKVAPSPEQVDH